MIPHLPLTQVWPCVVISASVADLQCEASVGTLVGEVKDKLKHCLKRPRYINKNIAIFRMQSSFLARLAVLGCSTFLLNFIIGYQGGTVTRFSCDLPLGAKNSKSKFLAGKIKILFYGSIE